MSDVSRRALLRNVALAAGLEGLDPALAQHVHQMASDAKKTGAYAPKAFTAAEFKTVQVLCERIVPGAAKGNAAEFIDLLCSASDELRAQWTGGLAWINRRVAGGFAAATEAAQTALLDQIAYRKNESLDLGPGIRFFDLARRMTVDAYYTSKAGIEEIGFQGNKGMTEFEIPAEAIQYALKRSPFA